MIVSEAIDIRESDIISMDQRILSRILFINGKSNETAHLSP